MKEFRRIFLVFVLLFLICHGALTLLIPLIINDLELALSLSFFLSSGTACMLTIVDFIRMELKKDRPSVVDEIIDDIEE